MRRNRMKRVLLIMRICRSFTEARVRPCLSLPGSAQLGIGQWLWEVPLAPTLAQPDNSLSIFPLTYCHFGVQSVYPQHSASSDTA